MRIFLAVRAIFFVFVLPGAVDVYIPYLVLASAPGGFAWDVALVVDGEERSSDTGYRMLFPMSPFEGIDVGLDRRSPVSWEIYEADGCFPFTGLLRAVRYEPGEPAPDSAWRWIETLREMGARFE